MTKYFKFFEIAYLIIAIFFIVETFLTWNVQREKAYLYLIFSLLAVFMYFFRRKYRKKFENQDRSRK
jgi:positive regulator of sigma E activity